MKKITLIVFLTAFWCGSFSQSVFTVNPSKTYQTIIGMGGHGYIYINDSKSIQYLVEMMGLSAYRHWIEVEDPKANYVTLANIASGSIPFKEVTANSISFFALLKQKNFKVIATCWSPPACLKKNNCVQAFGTSGICGDPCVGMYNCPDDNNILLPEHFDEYARYLSLWAKDFQKRNNISLYAVSIQNEPMFNEPYASALLFSSAYGLALKAVRDTFAVYPELSGIKFFGPEHMAGYSINSGDKPGSKYIQDVVDNPAFKPLLDAYAVHGYSDGIESNLGNSSDWTAFYNKIVVENNKMIWMTETYAEMPDWATAYGYMKGMFMSFKSGKLSLWTYWNMSSMYSGGYPGRALYNHMHFYRFIRPGAQMIEITDADSDVEAIAFKNGNDITVVAINMNKTLSKTIKFNEFAGKPDFFHHYQSNSMDMCAYVGKVTDNSFLLGPESVNTITYTETGPDVTYGPKPITAITTTSITDNSISVTWPATPASWTLNGATVNNSGYFVYVNGVKKTNNGPITGTSYTLTGLKPGTKYTIEISARDAMFNQSVYTKLEVTTTCVLGGCAVVLPGEIEETVNSLSITPNPATDAIRVDSDEEVLNSVSIIDITGKIVLSKEMVPSNESISVANLPNGIYIVIAKGQNKTMTSKFVKE